MSETATIVVEKVFTKDGTGKRGPWTRYDIKDGNGTRYSTFDAEKGKLAQANEGQRFEVEYEPNQYGNDLKGIKGPVAETNGDTPPLGTGEYVKAQTAPSDKQSIHRSVALKAAVDSMGHTIPATASPKTAYLKVIPLADAYVKWLEGSPAVETPELAPGDEDIPF